MGKNQITQVFESAFKVNNKKTLKVKNNNKCVTKITLNSTDIKKSNIKKRYL